MFQTLILAGLGILTEGAVSVATTPPVVVETQPRAGARGVAANVTEIRIVFSKDMLTDRMWSVVKVSDESFPELAGDVHYLDDARTFVIPVRLAPGKAYAMWLNSSESNAFRDKSGNPAVPYLLVFETHTP